MPDYSDWPEKRLRPTALLLDVLNPRIPPVANPLSQRELIAELVAHDDVYDLAKTIVGVGFDPVESLIGIEDDGKVVILEGNRRLAALKLLNDPTLATPSDLSKFKRIAGAASVPDTVRVLIAPSREAAAPLILRKHTREQVAKWSRLQQARFYRRLVDTGGSVEQVAKKYGVTAGEIRDFLRMDSMYAVAQTMDLPEDVRETVHDPRSFPASVLERLLEVPSFRDFLTIDFDASGRVSAKTKPAAFRRAYGRVLTDIAKKKIDTRTLNKADAVDEYVDGLSNVRPKAEARTYNADALAGQESATSASNRDTSTRPSRSKVAGKAAGVIPTSIKCTVDDDRIREIFRELKRLNPKVGGFPNAHAVLLRVLLELSVSHYLTKTGGLEPLLEWAKKQKKPNDWAPTLKQMLRELLKDAAVKLAPQARKAITRLVDDDSQSAISVDTMDQFVHNQFEWPNDREIARLWKLMEPILALVLKEPSSPKASA